MPWLSKGVQKEMSLYGGKAKKKQGNGVLNEIVVIIDDAEKRLKPSPVLGQCWRRGDTQDYSKRSGEIIRKICRRRLARRKERERMGKGAGKRLRGGEGRQGNL